MAEPVSHQPGDLFEGFSPAMVIGYMYQELGEDGLRGFLNMLCNPTDEIIVEACTPFMGTVTPYDLQRLRRDVLPLADYAEELDAMGLEHVADIVMSTSTFASTIAPSSTDGVTSKPRPE